MKHKYIELCETTFKGHQVNVPVSDMDSVDFVNLWNRVMDLSKNTRMTDQHFYIGFEDYSQLTPKNRSFKYTAAMPMLDDEVSSDYDYIVLEKGTYIVFENKISTHGPQFFKKVHEFIQKENINIEKSFDFELVPFDFNRDNPESLIYAAFKVK